MSATEEEVKGADVTSETAHGEAAQSETAQSETAEGETAEGEAPAPQKAVRSQVGRVTSNKMDKTVTVLLERRVKHALYGKYLTRASKVHAHDDTNDCHEGDLVRITECRPFSKTKNWQVIEVVERAL